MIRFDLSCANDHAFDSWFRSGADCDALLDKKLVSCSKCGNTTIRKALMAPKVATSNAITAPPRDTALADFKRTVESTADDVGDNFANEARAMHDGEKPDRPIYGQASGAEARALLSDGIPVLPLPFVPTKKTN